MQTAVRKPPRAEEALRLRTSRVGLDRGQAMLEFLIAALVGIVLILGILQVTLIYNARSLVKLAAFNAARAAIVTRLTGRSTSFDVDEPATMAKSKDHAKRAAFLTLLPVIPAVQGRIDPTKPAPDVAVFEKMAQTDADLSSGAASGLDQVFPGRADVALYEFNGQTIDDDKNLVDCIEIRFVNPTADLTDEAAINAATINSWDEITFDDPTKNSEENLVKVLVTWRYPLVIPFVNRIITAVARPKLYQAALTASGSTATLADLEVSKDPNDPRSRNFVPLWATGYAFTQVTPGMMGVAGLGGGIAGAFSGITIVNPPPAAGSQVDAGNTVAGAGGDPNAPVQAEDQYAGEVVFTKPSDNNSIRQTLGEFLVFRIPIRATYIMRMQWDRKG